MVLVFYSAVWHEEEHKKNKHDPNVSIKNITFEAINGEAHFNAYYMVSHLPTSQDVGLMVERHSGFISLLKALVPQVIVIQGILYHET